MKHILVAFTFLVMGCVTGQEIEPPVPEIPGLAKKVSANWGTILIDDRYVVYNNVWNKQAAVGDYHQEIFQGTDADSSFIGWNWKWNGRVGVIAYPEIMFGISPWGGLAGHIPELPYLIGTRSLSATFDVDIEATGTYNMTFDIWAISKLPIIPENISHEIMIWNITKMWSSWSWATKLGKAEIDGTTFDVYSHPNHGDASGGNKKKWTYIAFVSRNDVLRATWKLDPFFDFLVERSIMKTSDLIANVEFGNEVMSGSGTVKIRKYSVDVK
jgi:hypothetical protein